ncbi:MAG: leucine-rich repeat protein [Lachnospiraceae bacterium]|nr:leucine-rich repeat protein [Lachnospiraceae bacterium]
MEKVLCYNCFHEVDSGVKFCTNCGKSMIEDRSKHPQALPWGTVLGGRYIVGRVIGQGGFGITYAAQDYKTKEKVAVKEFFPDSMAIRGETGAAVPYSGQRGDDFTYGKATFLEEAKTLAEFNDVDGIVHVYSYFEENDTAYFAMEFVDGVSFQSYIENAGGRISFEDAKRILIPVMDAMAKVHSRGIIHRDIKPDNIYVLKDGQVRILDFGSARYSMGEKSRSLDVVLTHGFAPREQYSRHGRQGAYTDVYALGATFYYAITGRKPQDSIDRMDEDNLAYPSSLGARISGPEEDALMKALAVEPQDRYQNMLQFKSALLGLPQQEPSYGAQTAFGAQTAYQAGTVRQGTGYGTQPSQSMGGYGQQQPSGTAYGAQPGRSSAGTPQGTGYGTQPSQSAGGYGYGQPQQPSGTAYGTQPGRSGAGSPQGTGYGTQPSQSTGGYGYGQPSQPGRSSAGSPQGTGYGTQPSGSGSSSPAQSPAQQGGVPASPVQQGGVPAVSPQQGSVPAVQPADTGSTGGGGNERPKWLIAVLAACVLLLVAIIAIAVSSSGKKKKEQTASSSSPAISITQTPTPVPESEESSTVSHITGSIGTSPAEGGESFEAGSGVSVLGYYPVYAMKYGDSSFGAAALAEQGMTGENTYMFFGSPTSGVIALVDGEEAPFTVANGQMTVEGESVPFSVNGSDVSIFVTTTEGQTFEYIFRYTDQTPPDGVGENLPAPGASGSTGSGALSGTCGASATWRIDTEEETLWIEGSGPMYDYTYQEDIPWFNYDGDIDFVKIADGITRIGSGAFTTVEMVDVDIPESVTQIGDYAFAQCKWLFDVEFPPSVTQIGKGVCADCENLGTIDIDGTNVTIGEDAFMMCGNLTRVRFNGTVASIGNDAFFDDNALVYYTESFNKGLIAQYGGVMVWVPEGATYWSSVYCYDYLMQLPDAWGRLVEDTTDANTVTLTHKASEEAGVGGVLVTVSAYENEADYKNLPSYKRLGRLEGEDKYSGEKITYYLVAVYPTDVQFTAATESEYKTIFNDLDTAFGYIVGKEGFIFYAE